ncbi:MAG: hypothetical protein E7254_11695 [Lachnospiraceae bacterium]|nr:hypothetical protein [Lachnospiraceae bacterium]
MERELSKEQIDSLTKKYCSYEIVKEYQDSTFLSIIDKTKRETYISKLLAYAIKTDFKFRTYIFEKAGCLHNLSADDEIEIVCEKYMGGSRADIYVEINNKNNELITLTIENKIDTQEHDDQTQEYYNWVKEKNDDNNYFLYIYPDYNPSKPSCCSFQELKYSQIGRNLDSEDYIIKDFKKHINQYLGEKNMVITDKDLFLLEKYSIIKNMEKEVSDKVKEIQNAIIDNVMAKINYKDNCECMYWKSYNNEVKEGINLWLVETALPTSIRLYLPTGYVENRVYYYSEIRFDDYNIFGEINVQNTIRIDDKELVDDYQNIFTHCNLWYSKYLVLNEEKFKSDKEKFSKEWIDELCDMWIRFTKSYQCKLDEVLQIEQKAL